MQRGPIGGFIINGMIALLLVATTTRGGSIFDDDWKPPAQREQPKQELPPVKSDAPPAPPTAPVTPATPNTPPTPVPQQTANTTPEHATPAKPPTPVNRPPDVVLLPPTSVTKSIPPSADRARSRKLLKEAFAEKLKDHSPAARKDLAGTLIEQVGASSGNVADQYVLVTGAIDAAEEGQSLDLAFRAIDLMASLFDIDALAAKNEAAAIVMASPIPWTDDGTNVRLAGDVETQLLADNDYADARRLLTAILRRAAHANDRALSARTQASIRDLDSTQLAWDALKSKLDRLKTAPADPQANFAVGSFLCFMQGKWDRGLPYLSHGDNAAAKSAAASELALSADADAAAVVALADAWWDLATQQPLARRSRILQHAGVLYQRAAPNLTGLKLVVAQKRLASIGPISDEATASHGTQNPSPGASSFSSAPSNLLRLVDPKLDAISGTWKVESDGLGVDSPGGAIARILYSPPAEYDFTLTFIRRQYHNSGEIVIVVPRGDERFGVGIGGGDNKVCYINGAHTGNAVLEDKRVYTVRVEVRKDTVAAFLDNALVTQAPALAGHADCRDDWFPGVGVFGIGSYNSVIFHSATVTSVAGAGKMVPRVPLGELPSLGKPAPRDPALRTVELLPLVDLDKDLIEGSAQFDSNHHMVCTKQRMRLRFPYQPPDEYDFRMVFRRIEGNDFIGQLVPAWEHGIVWGMGGTYNRFTGFEHIFGAGVRNNPTTVDQPCSLMAGRQYESIVYVRHGKVSATLDGKVISEFSSSGDGVAAADYWAMGAKTLGLIASESAVEFDVVQLREVTGQGKMVPHLSVPTLNKPAPQDKAQRVVDLIPLIDPAKDSFSATTPGGRIYKENSPSGAPMVGFGWHARLRIPYHPPAEYDLHIRCRRLEGGDAVAVIFSHGSSLGEIQVGAHANTLVGFAALNGQPLDLASSTVHGDMILPTNRPYDLVVHVRNRAVSASINGQLVAEHPTDWTDLSVPDHPETINGALGLRGYGTKWMFEIIEIREITGEGRPSPR